MFTGIIQSVGSIQRIEPRGGDVLLSIAVGKLDMSDVQLGDSIAVNGVCLTVVRFDKQSFDADVSVETLAVTSLKNWKAGTRVNLEKALTPTTRLGGHLVSGHVDGIGEIISRRNAARADQFTVRVPQSIKRYIAHKGSVCVDGISLTVNAVNDDCFELTLVPHTQAETNSGAWQAGTLVNIEVDVLARYLERLLQAGEAPAAVSSITESLLARSGFPGAR
ncbi:riboflavin synthase [Permianibacter sp. IMCC34836]|uniref:riboflavin synthase n=1 Tax=Permianibacter fluminis TaxID=2738515 RepID=UPI0015577B4B|nr:riboflavin synthase [Permianibacter fluminis]NQD36874.1 riboflavin synthase [Permianibacter fluminis]